MNENIMYTSGRKPSGTSGRSCTYYDIDFESVEDWSGTSGTHSKTDFRSLENGMKHS